MRAVAFPDFSNATRKVGKLARFFLIDQSLVNRGGHHYDYSTCIVAAAKELGFETIVAANRKVSADLTVDGTRVIPTFTETVYQKDSCLAGLRHLKRSRRHPADLNTATGWQRTKAVLSLRRFHRRRAWLVSKFAREFQSFFDSYPIAEEDQVFLTTVSELELMGLAKYLRANPCSVLANWHLQFHFNIFDGRTPEYDSQKMTENLVRSSFQSSLAQLTCHRLFFYTTSQPLADQYNRLDVGDFLPLPYPVAPEFAWHPENARPADLNEQFDGKRRSLEFACPGQIRREKGCSEYLQPLVDKLWSTHLATGKINIAIQRPRRKLLRREKIELRMPLKDFEGYEVNTAGCSPFKYYAHPLSRPDYIEFLRNADCGLLMYDSRAYFSRRAGVLGEMLSCGKPLIVPAGSWLASQIAEPVFKHADTIEATSKDSRRLEIEELEWSLKNAPSSGGAISFDGEKHPFKFSLNRQPEEQLLKIEFQWKWPQVSGTYCRICISQRDNANHSLGEDVQVIGRRDGDRLPNALFRLHSATDSVHVTLSNAYSNSTAIIRQLSTTLLVPDKETKSANSAPSPKSRKTAFIGGGAKANGREIVAATAFQANQSVADVETECALGSVGIIVADQSQLDSAVKEMVTHFDHYRSTAEAFAGRWFAMHHPNRTVAHLIGAGDRSQNASNRS